MRELAAYCPKVLSILINRAILQCDNYTPILVNDNKEYWRTIEEFPFKAPKDITRKVSTVFNYYLSCLTAVF